MVFNNVFTLFKKIMPTSIIAQKELEDYTWDGIIEFTNSPTFTMNIKHFLVMNYFINQDNEIFLKKEDKLIPVNKEDIQFFQIETCKLGPNFSLQDFFDKNKDAKCIVFYLSETSGSLFHEGYKIRAVVITDELIKNRIIKEEK